MSDQPMDISRYHRPEMAFGDHTAGTFNITREMLLNYHGRLDVMGAILKAEADKYGLDIFIREPEGFEDWVYQVKWRPRAG